MTEKTILQLYNEMITLSDQKNHYQGWLDETLTKLDLKITEIEGHNDYTDLDTAQKNFLQGLKNV